MANNDYITINGSKEAVTLLSKFFLDHGFEADDCDSAPDPSLYYAPPVIPTEIFAALIGCAGAIIVQLMQIFEQRRKEAEKKGNHITLDISISQYTIDSYSISIKGDSPENLKLLEEVLSAITESLKKPNP